MWASLICYEMHQKKNFVCKLSVDGENYTFFPAQKCVEQLHNYMIVNELFLFFLMCKMSKYMCYKKLLCFGIFRAWNRVRNKLSVGLRSTITARRAELLLVSFNAVYGDFFGLFSKHIVSKKNGIFLTK